MRRLLWVACCVAGAWAAPPRVVLLEELIRVQPMERKTVVVFPLEQQGGEVQIRFDAKSAGEGVQVRLFADEENKPLAESPYQTAGRLQVPVTKDRNYRVVVENLRQRLGFGLVDMEVALVFGNPPAAPAAESSVRMLDPERRRATVAISLTLFVLVVAFSAIKLGPPILERMRG